MTIRRRANTCGLKTMLQHSRMRRTLTEIRSLARGHTKTAIRVLVGVMCSKDATHAARVSAANAILDRGWGKAAQALENSDDGALELIHKIERVIVHPEDPGSLDERVLDRLDKDM
jgi:hypothetical protein